MKKITLPTKNFLKGLLKISVFKFISGNIRKKFRANYISNFEEKKPLKFKILQISSKIPFRLKKAQQ